MLSISIKDRVEVLQMVATIIYWAVILVLIGWGLWSLIFSGVYLKNRENGNLLFFAIINVLLLLFGWFELWFFAHKGWQEYWMLKATATSPVLGYVLIGYVIMIALQLLLFREPKVKEANA